MEKVRNYLSLIKFSHTIFAMPFAMIGFVMAITYYPVHKFDGAGGAATDLNAAGAFNSGYSVADILLKLTLVILCMVFARSAAMAFNRYLDAHFDALNPRTAIREIPAGIISESFNRGLKCARIGILKIFQVTY